MLLLSVLMSVVERKREKSSRRWKLKVTFYNMPKGLCTRVHTEFELVRLYIYLYQHVYVSQNRTKDIFHICTTFRYVNIDYITTL